MNVKQMEMVLELSKTLNFNKAAQKLYITQPALSYQIKSLETEVGFRIFERRNDTGRKVILCKTSANTQSDSACGRRRTELQCKHGT